MKSALTSELDIKWKVGDPAPPSLTPFTEAELLKMWGGKTEPVVSILCPTYNHRGFVRQALDGFLGQVTDFPFEVIVRDDASSDGTADIVREYAHRYPHIVHPILEEENTFSQGVSFIPPLAKKAKGEFIALCAGDDYWIDSEKLSQQVSILENDRTAVAVHHEACSIRNGIAIDCPINSPASRADISKKDMGLGVMAMPLTLCFRKAAVDLSLAEFDKILNEDDLIYSQLSLHGYSVYIPKVMAAYRLHSNSVWNSLSKKKKFYEKMNSNIWIANYHFRSGSSAPGRTLAMRAGNSFCAQADECDWRVAVFILYGTLRRCIKRLLSLHH